MEIKLNYTIRPKAHQSVRLTKKGYSYTPKSVKLYKNEIAKQVVESLTSSV